MESKEVDTTYHPSYASSDADIVLKSRDGVLFRAHSIILSVASGFFRDMLSLPRAAGLMDSADDAIVMDETTEVLKALLDAIYPNSTTALAESLDFETFRDLMFILTHKYDFNAGEKIAKGIIHDDRLSFKFPPILMFGAMKHIGWDEEARKASTATLKSSLFTDENQAYLRRLQGHCILDLMAFHHRRREAILRALDPPDWLDPSAKCEKHEGGLCFQPIWSAFKQVLLAEVDRVPSGETLKVLEVLPKKILQMLKTTHTRCGDCVPDKSTYTLVWDSFCSNISSVLNDLPQDISS